MRGRNVAVLSIVVLLVSMFSTANADSDKPGYGKGQRNWVASWASAPATPSPFDFQGAPPPVFNDTTLRQIARVSAGGHKVRVWLTNEFGTAPLRIDAATVALQADGAAIIEQSKRRLTFGGNADITIAPGTRVVSDPVRLHVPDLADVAVSIHLPDDMTASSSPFSFHVRALQTSYLAPGNQTAEVYLTSADPIVSWYYFAGIDVLTRKPGMVVAALGDSVTDGDQQATMEPVDENARYTNFLARRLLRRGNNSVINLGYSGNQLTADFIGENGQARLARDVLAQTGVTHLIALEGINDIGLPGLLTAIGIPTPAISAQTIISGHQQIIARARAKGIVVIGGTLPPSGSSPLPGYSGPEVEAKRQAVNAWIRDEADYDTVVDFDRVLRDPGDPTIMRDDLTADGLHPNTDGYRAMGRAAARVIRRLGGHH